MRTLRTSARRRPHRRRDTERPPITLFKAAIAIAVVGLLVALSLSIYHGLPWVSYKTIYAKLPEVGDLLPHDPVRIAGVRVGQVSGITVDRRGEARLRLQIDPGTKLPYGTTFAVRADSLLGARYVQLVPGHGNGELPSGYTLHGDRDSLTFGVPDVLNVLDAETRGRLGQLISGLGEGLLGRGTALNGTIHEIAAESIPAQQLISALNGPGQLRLLVPSLQSAMEPLDTARSTITAMLPPLSASLQPLVDQRGAVRSALDQAPPALAAATAGLANGKRLLDAAYALSVQARDVLPPAPSALQATADLLRISHPALARADRLLQAAEPASPAALRITAALSPVLAPLSQLLSRATPVANQVAPYGCNIENFGAVMRSMTGFGGGAGVPGGPAGAAMAFRLELIPAGAAQLLGIKDSTLIRRVGYSAPCHFLSSVYPTTFSPLSGLGGQR